jgi:hypothetical protein
VFFSETFPGYVVEFKGLKSGRFRRGVWIVCLAVESWCRYMRSRMMVNPWSRQFVLDRSHRNGAGRRRPSPSSRTISSFMD